MHGILLVAAAFFHQCMNLFSLVKCVFCVSDVVEQAQQALQIEGQRSFLGYLPNT